MHIEMNTENDANFAEFAAWTIQENSLFSKFVDRVAIDDEQVTTTGFSDGHNAAVYIKPISSF